MHGFIIKKIRSRIRQLTEQNWAIHFKWVKAHIGIEGNETADKLAKEAAKEDENLYAVNSRIPITAAASDITKKGLEPWQQQWDTMAKGAECRLLLPQSRTEAKAEDTINTRIYGTGNRARENKILLTQIQANRRPEVPLQRRAADTRPHNL